MKILFPCHELEGLKKVDDAYLEEHHAAKLQGHDCYLFDHDKFVRGSLSTNLPESEEEKSILLRGWMLSVSEYEDLYNMLKNDFGYVLINTPEQYKNCHHFPESYDYTKEHTSKAIFIKAQGDSKEWDAEVLQSISDFFGDKDFLMKDFVKSAKDYPELFRMPAGISGEDLLDKVNKFVEHRGKLFSEGLVFKEFVDLKRDTEDKLNEWRIFFYENRMVSASPNSNQSDWLNEYPGEFIDSVVKDIAFQIDSNFFTIDVSQKEDGSWMIIETGDGQVSGLSPNQNCLEFYTSIEEAKVKE